jgi:hypothetical protein
MNVKETRRELSSVKSVKNIWRIFITLKCVPVSRFAFQWDVNTDRLRIECPGFGSRQGVWDLTVYHYAR